MDPTRSTIPPAPLRSSASLLALAAAVSCTAAAAPLPPPPGGNEPPVDAHRAPTSEVAAEREGFLPTTPAPERSAAAIAELRGRGAAGLASILREYDAASPARKPALASTVDAVAAQRYATASRLFWHTDLPTAQAEAARTGKPILALRMLGRLDEDLSCANSRFFRTALYPDRQVAELLRERFILLWTTERPVPRVTIDFGDGRRMMSTVTGNSVHYVLDADGGVLDALPGMYAPKVFADELRGALALAAELRQLRQLRATDPAQVELRLAAYREAELAAIDLAFQNKGAVVWSPRRYLFARQEARTRMEQAQGAALSKALVERPILLEIAPGTDPGSIHPSEISQWASIGQSMFAIGSGGARAEPEGPAADRSTVEPAAKRRGAAAAAGYRLVSAMMSPFAPPRREDAQLPLELPVVFDERSRQLILAVVAAEPGAPPRRRTAAPAAAASSTQLLSPTGRRPEWDDALIARFEQRVVADTAQNQVMLRTAILRHLGISPVTPPLDELNAWVYQQVFSTPRDDAWLGLRTPDEFSGLPGDGVVVSAGAPREATATARTSRAGNGYTRRR